MVHRKAAWIVASTMVACGIDAIGTARAPDDPYVDAETPDVVEADALDPPDGAGQGDADASAPIIPSHVDASLLLADGGALVGPGRIDTTLGTIDLLPPSEGIVFTMEDGGADGIAILSLGSLTVDKELLVTGDRALVVLATGAVEIGAPIRVDATGALKGPGGYGPGAGPGAGGPGATGAGNDNAAGGGAGHLVDGARGGDGGATRGADGGAAYALALVGGSGGGRGDPPLCTIPGGAGGGAIQIFSRVRIAISGTGGVNAAGGGGHGTVGCPSGSGAGGGAGGYVLLEAPIVEVDGIVAANGGGGGGGDIFNGTGSTPGRDGTYGAERAGGGIGSQSAGGAGGSVAGPPTGGGSSTNGAGGGGSAGRIVVRVRSGLLIDGGVLSPAPDIAGL